MSLPPPYPLYSISSSSPCFLQRCHLFAQRPLFLFPRVCLHACCVYCSVISHTDSPLVAGDWFNIPLGNLCRTNSLQEWKGLEEGWKREGKKCREEEICGEIIILGVTVATFCEVDVNNILSYPIHFNFTSKRCCRGPRGRWNKESACTSTHTREHISVKLTAMWRLPTCAAYRPAGKHIIACSHLTCQNSRAPCLLIFGFSSFELLKIKWKRMMWKMKWGERASQEGHWEKSIDYGHLWLTGL